MSADLDKATTRNFLDGLRSFVTTFDEQRDVAREQDALALTECDRIPEGDYLVLSKKVGKNLQIPPEQIDECNLPLKKVFENRRFIVYELLD